jgi:PAS domain S-box-containing protein
MTERWQVPRFLLGTLRGRLILGVAAVTGVLMALFVADLTRRQAEMLLDRQVDEAKALSQALATSAAGWILSEDVSGLQELVDAQRRYPELQYALLTDRRGRVRAATDPARRGQWVVDLPAEAGVAVLSRSPQLVDVAAPATLAGRHVGWARVGVSQGAAAGKLREITRSGIAYAAVAIALAALVAWALAWRATRRLYAIQRTIDAVRGGDPRARTALDGHDEAAVLAREFDGMLDAAEERDARLRASEEKFRGLVRDIQVAVVVHGPDTRIRTANLLAQRLLGLTEAQLLGKAAVDPDWRFTREDGSRLPLEEYPVSRVLATGEPVRDVVLGVYRPVAGDQVLVNVNADPERDEREQIVQVVVTFVDVTARRAAEQAVAERTLVAELSSEIGHLLATQRDLRSMLRGCAEALVRRLDAAFARIWVADPSAQVLELQASAGLYTRLDGTHRRIQVGEGMIGRIGRDRAMHATNAVFGDPLVEDHEWARREGLVAFAGTPLVVEGKLVGVLAMFSRKPLTDVTVKAVSAMANELAIGIERKMAEEALRRGEERYRRIVETAHEGIWLIDAGNRTTFANRQMATMLGYTVEEMQGALLTDFMDDEGRALAARNVERRRQGIAEQHDFKFRRKDGTELWTLVETTPFFDDHGEYAGALGMITDVTDRRRMEEQLRQSQKLEAVGRLAGGVAHDFNNLLTAILGDADAISEGLPARDPLREDVGEIRAAAHKAAMLTRQLLAFGRKQAAEPRVLDVGETVGAMERLLRRLIGENIDLTVACPAGLWSVRADPGQIEQVIVNLAVNARDAMPGGGRLTIETSNVELRGDDVRRHIEAAPGPYVMVAVSDTGSGMSPEVQAHLFEPFYTTKGRGGGTGLGLSTVYGIVKQCGGCIWVYSEAGRGTTFKIYLPRVDQRPEAEETRPEPARARGTETLLVVEDEAMVRAMAVRVLRGAGYTVLDAGDGVEACQVLADAGDRKIDLLVADVIMPRLGGPELAARLRETRPELRVLFVSGYTDRALDLQGELGPRTAFLSKPFAGAQLAAKVREVLDRDAGAARSRLA